MEIYNPQTLDHVVAYDGESLKCRVLDIGDWDINAVNAVEVTHGLTWSDIRSIQVWIRNDANDFLAQLNADNGLVGCADGIVNLDQGVRPGKVFLQRKIGGYFNNVNYDATSYNRGWVFIWYID